MHELHGIGVSIDVLPPHCVVEVHILGTDDGPTAVRFRAMRNRWVLRGRFHKQAYGYTNWYELPTAEPIELHWNELVALPVDDEVDDDDLIEPYPDDIRVELSKRMRGSLAGAAVAIALSFWVGKAIPIGGPSGLVLSALIGTCLGLLGVWLGGAYAVSPKHGEGIHDDDDDEEAP